MFLNFSFLHSGENVPDSPYDMKKSILHQTPGYTRFIALDECEPSVSFPQGSFLLDGMVCL